MGKRSTFFNFTFLFSRSLLQFNSIALHIFVIRGFELFSLTFYVNWDFGNSKFLKPELLQFEWTGDESNWRNEKSEPNWLTTTFESRIRKIEFMSGNGYRCLRRFERTANTSLCWMDKKCVCADSSPNEHTECQKIAFFSHFTLLFVCPFLTSRLFSSTFLSYSAWGHFPFYFFFFLFRFLHIFRQPFPSINSSKFTIVFGNIQRIVSHFCRMFLRVHNMFHYYHHQCRVWISLFIQRLALISVTFILPTWMLTTRHGIVCPFIRYDFLCLVDILVRFLSMHTSSIHKTSENISLK